MGNYSIVHNTIVFDEPQRIEGQKSVLQFAVDPIENVRIGFIGLGMRGPDAVDRMTYIDGVTVVALCDIEPDRVESVQTNILEKKGLPTGRPTLRWPSTLCKKVSMLPWKCPPPLPSRTVGNSSMWPNRLNVTA